MILGAGVMGLMNVIAAKQRGARVIVSEIDADRLARARAYRGRRAHRRERRDPVARVKALTEGRGAEAVIAAIGSREANEQGMAMLSERGRFVLFAATHPEPEFTIQPNAMHNRETGVVGAVSKDKQDFYTAIRLIRYGLVDLAPLIEATYPFARIGEALDHAIRPGSYRVIVTQ